MGMIHNPENVPITKKEIYNNIIEYTVPEDYYFESCGTSYGILEHPGVASTPYYRLEIIRKEITTP